MDEGILDLMITKSWAIKLATEAARTVLSVDQIIIARQAGGPKPPGPNPVSCKTSSPHGSKANSARTGTKTRVSLHIEALRRCTLLRLNRRYSVTVHCHQSFPN